jgi:hypothetical protein
MQGDSSIPTWTQEQLTRQQGRGHLLSLLVAWGALFLAGGVLFLVFGAFRDPTGSLHGMLGSALWTTLGPHFVLVSLFALSLGIYARRQSPSLSRFLLYWQAGQRVRVLS